jgi:hypothetical protein
VRRAVERAERVCHLYASITLLFPINKFSSEALALIKDLRKRIAIPVKAFDQDGCHNLIIASGKTDRELLQFIEDAIQEGRRSEEYQSRLDRRTA